MGKKVDTDVKTSEANRLKYLFEKHEIDNYALFARENIIPGGKAMINQHKEGTRPISLEAGMAYAKAFNCQISEISPRLADIALRSSSLLPLVNSKNSSPDSESLNSLNQRGTSSSEVATPQILRSFHVIPIYRLGAVMHNEFNAVQPEGSVEIPGTVGNNAYAIRVEDDAMAQASPPLSKGMLVIFDPDTPPRHAAIVLAGDPGTQPVIRQVFFDGPDLYLSAPQSGIPPRKVTLGSIRAVAVKAIIDLL